MPRTATPPAAPPDTAQIAQSETPAATPQPLDPWAALNAVVEAYKVSPPDKQAIVRARLAEVIPGPITDTDIRCASHNLMSRTNCNALLAEEATRPYRLLCRRCHMHTLSPDHPSMAPHDSIEAAPCD